MATQQTHAPGNGGDDHNEDFEAGQAQINTAGTDGLLDEIDAWWQARKGQPYDVAEATAFLQDANPEALAAMRARFAELHDAGLWQTRRNAILAELGTGT